jgi:hypothetical protein
MAGTPPELLPLAILRNLWESLLEFLLHAKEHYCKLYQKFSTVQGPRPINTKAEMFSYHIACCNVESITDPFIESKFSLQPLRSAFTAYSKEEQ